METLAAARTVWSRGQAMPLSAPYIYLHLITAPAMMKVEQQNSRRLDDPRRTAGDLRITAGFIANLVDLPENPVFAGGKENPLVALTVAQMGERHRAFSGMQPWMIEYFAFHIALAPLRVLGREPLNDPVDRAYLDYMSEAWKLMGVDLDLTRATTHQRMTAVTNEQAGPWPGCAAALGSLRGALDYLIPEQPETAWQTVLKQLDPGVRAVVDSAVPDAGQGLSPGKAIDASSDVPTAVMGTAHGR